MIRTASNTNREVSDNDSNKWREIEEDRFSAHNVQDKLKDQPVANKTRSACNMDQAIGNDKSVQKNCITQINRSAGNVGAEPNPRKRMRRKAWNKGRNDKKQRHQSVNNVNHTEVNRKHQIPKRLKSLQKQVEQLHAVLSKFGFDSTGCLQKSIS